VNSKTSRATGRVGWDEVWHSLQPSELERDLSAQILAASGGTVVARWVQRGLSPTGERIEMPVIGVYEVLHGQCRRGQMFYFDTVAVRDSWSGPADQPPPAVTAVRP
jgi:limonene-1,2-epoxide hydrolase